MTLREWILHAEPGTKISIYIEGLQHEMKASDLLTYKHTYCHQECCAIPWENKVHITKRADGSYSVGAYGRA